MYNNFTGHPASSSPSPTTTTPKATADAYPINVHLPICVASDHKHDEHDPACQADVDHWAFTLKQIRKSVYHSTTVSLPSPAYFLLQYETRFKNDPVHAAKVKRNFENSEILGPYFHNFNSDPLAAKDMLDYRALRSEHLLIRLADQIHLSKRISQTIVRLAKGRFLVQQYEYIEPPHSSINQQQQQQEPYYYASTNRGYNNDTVHNNNINDDHNCLLADPYFDFLLRDENDLTTIDTFTFESLFQNMLGSKEGPKGPASFTSYNNSTTDSTTIDFIPFTYTIGVRYTHPYHGIRDILVRGRIPDWCRTLIITECMRNLPIKPGMVLSGLLPFAKDMQFHFTQLSRKTIPYIYPDMLVSYEKMTMDLCWPQSPFDTEKQSPPQQRQSRLQQHNPPQSFQHQHHEGQQQSHLQQHNPPQSFQHQHHEGQQQSHLQQHNPPQNFHHHHEEQQQQQLSSNPVHHLPMLATVPNSPSHQLYPLQSATRFNPYIPPGTNSSAMSYDSSNNSFSNSNFDDYSDSCSRLEEIDENVFIENILCSVAMCDIPDHTAAIITKMANEWVANQQTIFSPP